MFSTRAGDVTAGQIVLQIHMDTSVYERLVDVANFYQKLISLNLIGSEWSRANTVKRSIKCIVNVISTCLNVHLAITEV